MLSRKLFSVLATGAALAALTISTPLAGASETVAEQTAQEIADTQPFTYPSYYLLAGDTDTFAPLRDELPAGTTLALEEGSALEALRADGWAISVTDNLLSVTAPCDGEGDYRIPVIVTSPDQSTQAASVGIFVDYLVDPFTSSLVPGGIGCQLSKALGPVLGGQGSSSLSA